MMAGTHIRPRAPLPTLTTRPCCICSFLSSLTRPTLSLPQLNTPTRAFSITPHRKNWLTPKRGESSKSRKGSPAVHTGGSTRGTTVVWGDYGIRLLDHHRRISAQQLKIADETIRKRLRGMRFRLYHRVNAGIGVYTSGNDQRMGKGKGTFDYWAARVAVSKVLFELKGDVHEQVVRDAMRLAGNKLPGKYEFVRKGDPAVMGITKLSTPGAGLGTSEAELRRPRLSPQTKSGVKPNIENTARRLPATTGP